MSDPELQEHRIVVGIDTHADTHHVAVVTEYGKPLGDQAFPTTAAGYRDVLAFITGFGEVLQVGMEGTGTYGAALTKVLQRMGVLVIEVNRPDRQQRRLKGKTDSLDAYRAAQSVITGRSTAVPKAKDGPVECLRVLRASRVSAVKSRSAAINQIKSLLISAPEGLRSKYQGMTTATMIGVMARSRPSGHLADPTYMTARVLRSLAVRYQHLSTEIEDATVQLHDILQSYAPMLQELTGVGPDVASQLLVTFGDNRERVGNEAQFAALTGVAPIPASSGKTSRHRLSRGGDRQANCALHHIVLVRMNIDPRTKDYVVKRTEEGKSKREIMRCLKRYIAREVYRQITNPTPAPPFGDLRPLRHDLGLTLQDAATYLDEWPSTLSRLERGRTRNDHLLLRYRAWLHNQRTMVGPLPTVRDSSDGLSTATTAGELPKWLPELSRG
ncbi:IS110 family transposase [Arthrobacter sp. B1805]|uniref:IS110 family transposase n=1 Tax=Arthrobacter sp. B1805 TaxID=2058892 RepID=UPI0021573010|nr:IS110 family transposase [Arthrobacter sp. B1805]